MRTAFVLLLSLAAAPLVARPAHAQPGEELWDGVVAVVGDTVLLRSDLALFLEQVRAQGNQAVPEEGPALDAFLANLVEERVSDLLLLEGARASGLAVANEEIQLAVDEQLREVRARFPTEAAYAQALREAGRTPETYRAELARQFADQTLVQRFIRQATQQMAPPAVSDAEVRAFFTANRERFGTRPASISFQQVIVRPLPNDSARAAALRTAEQVQRELTEGVEFEVLARRYGTDGTRERGGDLGWFRQGQMVRSFDQVVFAMRPGTTSGIVETEFGFHIIKLDERRAPDSVNVQTGEQVRARHILIAASSARRNRNGPPQSPREQARLAVEKQKLDKLVDDLVSRSRVVVVDDFQADASQARPAMPVTPNTNSKTTADSSTSTSANQVKRTSGRTRAGSVKRRRP